MTTCTSCGRPIPDGQGRSCSMCYGDIDYGRDGYAREEIEQLYRREEEERQAAESGQDGPQETKA